MKQTIVAFFASLLMLASGLAATIVTTAGVSTQSIAYPAIDQGTVGNMSITIGSAEIWWGFSFQQTLGFTPQTLKVEISKNGGPTFLLDAPTEYDYIGIMASALGGGYYLTGSINQGPASIVRLRNVTPVSTSDFGGFIQGDVFTIQATMNGFLTDNTPFSKKATTSMSYIPEPSTALLALLGLLFATRRTRS